MTTDDILKPNLSITTIVGLAELYTSTTISMHSHVSSWGADKGKVSWIVVVEREDDNNRIRIQKTGDDITSVLNLAWEQFDRTVNAGIPQHELIKGYLPAPSQRADAEDADTF